MAVIPTHHQLDRVTLFTASVSAWIVCHLIRSPYIHSWYSICSMEIILTDKKQDSKCAPFSFSVSHPNTSPIFLFVPVSYKLLQNKPKNQCYKQYSLYYALWILQQGMWSGPQEDGLSSLWGLRSQLVGLKCRIASPKASLLTHLVPVMRWLKGWAQPGLEPLHVASLWNLGFLLTWLPQVKLASYLRA